MATSIGNLALQISASSNLGPTLAKDAQSMRQFGKEAAVTKKQAEEGFFGKRGAGGALMRGEGGSLLGRGGFMGGLALAGLSLAVHEFERGEQFLEQWVQKIREIEPLLATAGDRAKAIQLGLIPENAEQIKALAAEAEKAKEPGAWSRGLTEFSATARAFQNTITDGFDRDIRGIKTETVEQFQLRQEEKKRFEERLKFQDETIKSFDEQESAIGRTANQQRILKLERMGADADLIKSLETQDRLIQTLTEEADKAKKLKDGLKSLRDELEDVFQTVGMTAGEKKLFDLQRLGLGGQDLKDLQELTKIGEQMAAGFSLVERPLKTVIDQLEGLATLKDSGRITQQEFLDASQKARKAFIDNDISKRREPDFLEKGSAAEVAFRRDMDRKDAAEKKLDQQIAEAKKANELAKEANKTLAEIAAKTSDAVAVVVMGD